MFVPRKPAMPDAVIGNSRLLVTLTGDGEIQRLFWPHVDGPQHVARFRTGLSLDGEEVRWLDLPMWEHRQYYEPDQNLLVTESAQTGGLLLRCIDAAVPGQDLLVRSLEVCNGGTAAVRARYILYHWLRFDESPLYNTALFHPDQEALLHYRREFYTAVGSDRPVRDFAVDHPDQLLEEITAGRYNGLEILHGDVAGALVWDLGLLHPGESVSLSLFWALGQSADEVLELLQDARDAGSGALLARTRAYWSAWLEGARELEIPLPGEGKSGWSDQLPGLPVRPVPAESIVELYRRSLLLFKLMSDEETGAVIAAPEFDPAYASSGGYAYCWGRDAVFVAVAMDLSQCHELAGRFYRWAIRAQEQEGWWMHRHYADGHWAPSWGLVQVDETGSILYGISLHARLHGGEPFAQLVWPSVRRAADWLMGNLDPQTGLPNAAVDLWEERTSQTTYSSGAVMAGLFAAAEIGEMVQEPLVADQFRHAAEVLREAILRECVCESTFLRGRYLQVTEKRYAEALAGGRTVRRRMGPKGHPIYELAEDPVPDSSLLAMSVPFGVVDPSDPVMEKTAAHLVKALWTAPVGGMRRYVGDHYRDGLNPWVLCTLWLGLYELERGDRQAAERLLAWAVERRNRTGLLSEQVDPKMGRPVWVVPLTWSHAMFVLLALRLYGDPQGAR